MKKIFWGVLRVAPYAAIAIFFLGIGLWMILDDNVSGGMLAFAACLLLLRICFLVQEGIITKPKQELTFEDATRIFEEAFEKDEKWNLLDRGMFILFPLTFFSIGIYGVFLGGSKDIFFGFGLFALSVAIHLIVKIIPRKSSKETQSAFSDTTDAMTKAGWNNKSEPKSAVGKLLAKIDKELEKDDWSNLNFD